MGYAQEQIDRANRVNLEEFLRSQGKWLMKSGNEYRWERHDSLTVKKNKRFRHSRSKGGYPVEFVMEFFGKSFPEAVELLIGEAPADTSPAAAQPQVFRLPPRNKDMERLMGYFLQRKIPEELVREFCREGLIYENALHHKTLCLRAGTKPEFHDMSTVKEPLILPHGCAWVGQSPQFYLPQ